MKKNKRRSMYVFYRQITPTLEYCYYVVVSYVLSAEKMERLKWCLAETFQPDQLSTRSFLKGKRVVEIGARLSATTTWASNAFSELREAGLHEIVRIERFMRYKLKPGEDRETFIALHCDKMREMVYETPLTTLISVLAPEAVKIVPVLERGRVALEEINRELGLGFDEWDIDYYLNLIVNDLKRNPTNVELFDLGQSNSEHSRHWFFKGKIVIDGKEMPQTLMDVVKEPWLKSPGNSIIAFGDNSSAIRGYEIKTIMPQRPGQCSRFVEKEVGYHPIFTAETHNFPSGVAPFPGAETGTGGRIRDVQAVGRGGLVIAGTAAYCVGNLSIPGYKLPWEDKRFKYPTNLASSLKIEVDASNGASDYGNKFGEPVIQGYTRSFGMQLPSGERREWLKPIMFTGGIGQMNSRHTEKGQPQRGMLVAKIGGPAYRIGIGGGAASSMIQGENKEVLDFNAVQRGDAEMEQKMNRVVRACVELGEKNPIISIHDQGAGGNCNVLKELIYPAGARLELRKIPLGDNTLSVLEIWGAEYQENNALLIWPDKADMFTAMCEREKVPCAIIGQITGDGYVVLFDANDGNTPVNLDLKKISGEMPQKTFKFDRLPRKLEPLKLPKGLTVRKALDRVLKLVSVGSKRFLTNKVDRSVTGLIAQQQCVGSLQLPLSDVAVVAQSHFGLTGAAISIGEQPIKGLINPAAMARMSVAEAITNIVWAKVTNIEDIRCSANWMWPAKLPGEGADLYDAAVAMKDLMIALGIAVDGGKDSLSMAAKVGKEIVKAPGSLVVSAYCTMDDITKVVTPDIKQPGNSRLIFIDLAKGKRRLGGSALAHVYEQIGDECPDVEDPKLLKRAFNAIQELISGELIFAGHDVSDGGLIVTLLEMAFAGNCGLDVNLRDDKKDALPALFSEEAGLVIEVASEVVSGVMRKLHEAGVSCLKIGGTSVDKKILVSCDGRITLYEDMLALRQIWEETSHQLQIAQGNLCAEKEKENIFDRPGPTLKLSFDPQPTPLNILRRREKPKVAIVRAEGSNGDREMTSAFHAAGFECWDIMMSDLIAGRITLDSFVGLVFVGGFSYADVMDSAKGWAGSIRFNKIRKQFEKFYHRPETFSLGVCNGCQLMALLGWVPWEGIENKMQPRFIRNKSGMFESRFATVKILPSPSIMLKGMEGSTLGIWVAHGEGRVHFPDKQMLSDAIKMNLAPMRFVDDHGRVTQKYPLNPNGSQYGITALCDPTGRHLAMMPHSERTFLKWQWPWMPEEWKDTLKASPWLKMFQNAREWCEQNK